MKTSAFISMSADFADRSGDHALVKVLRLFCSALSGLPDDSLPSVLTKLDVTGVIEASPTEPTLGDVRSALKLLRSSLTPEERRSIAKDFKALEKLLSARDSCSLTSFVASVRHQFASKAKQKRKRKATVNQAIVDKYLPQLEAALGDAKAFKSIFEELESNTEVGQAEAVAISREFMGRTASGTSRKAALERIWSRHAALMEFRAKRKAFGGRTAA